MPDVEYACNAPEALRNDRDQDVAFLRAMAGHLLSSGALHAAVRHAIATTTIELTTEADAHLTDAQIIALVICSDVCGGFERIESGNGVVRSRPHLPVAEQQQQASHVALCQRCKERAAFAADGMHLVAECAEKAVRPAARTNDFNTDPRR
jgi:hypothetical protein